MFVNGSLFVETIHLPYQFYFFEVLTMVEKGEGSCYESMVGVGLGRFGYLFGRLSLIRSA